MQCKVKVQVTKAKQRVYDDLLARLDNKEGENHLVEPATTPCWNSKLFLVQALHNTVCVCNQSYHNLEFFTNYYNYDFHRH